MRISRLRLRNVKRHADLELELAPGLTVIRGPNEAGKSTIQRALEIALFRKPTSTAQELDGIRRWSSPDEDPLVELSFEEEGTLGELKKRFGGQRGTVELRYDGQVVTDPAAVEEVVTRLTGLPSEKFYRATASIHHQELTGLEQDENTLRDRLQQSMSGADKGTLAAKRKLEEAIRRYRTEGVKNPGYLKLAREQVARLEASVTEGERALAQLERDRQTLVEARDARLTVEDRLGQYKQALEAAERALKLAQRAEEAAQRYAHYRKAEELRVEIGELEARPPSPLLLPELKAAVEGVRGLEYGLSELRAELAAEPDFSTYNAAIATPPWRPFTLAAGSLVLLALAALVGGFVLGQLALGLIAAGVLAVAAAAAAYVASGRRREITELDSQIQLREKDIARRLRGRSDLIEQVRDAERARDEALAALNLPDLAAAEALLEAQMEHHSRVDTLRAELRGVLGDERPAESFAVLRDRAAAEADEYRHALSGMGTIGAEPEKSHAKLRAAVETATREREQAHIAEAEARTRLEANSVDAEEVAARVEALEEARATLARHERRVRIYETVLAALEEAERSTMKKAARFLEQRMSRDVERITGGRYRRLQVDEAKLSFSVFSPELQDWTDVRNLSQGTLDQFYLCARLGIVRQVTQPATPPLVFDDPFVTFDDERARRAVELLREVAADHQIILLSSSSRYDDLADTVIELARPEQRDERPAYEGSEQLAANQGQDGPPPQPIAAAGARSAEER